MPDTYEHVRDEHVFASIEDAQLGDITFAESVRYLENARQSSASAILAPKLEGPVALSPDIGIGSKVLIEVDNPRLAFALLAGFTVFLHDVIRRGVAAPCRCFGAASDRPVGWGHLVRNGLLLVLALIAALAP